MTVFTQLTWLLLLPSGIYTNGQVSMTTPIVYPQLTLEQCVELQLKNPGSNCVALGVGR